MMIHFGFSYYMYAVREVGTAADTRSVVITCMLCLIRYRLR